MFGLTISLSVLGLMALAAMASALGAWRIKTSSNRLDLGLRTA